MSAAFPVVPNARHSRMKLDFCAQLWQHFVTPETFNCQVYQELSRSAKCCGSYRYLYKSNSPGVQDYLCNRLYALPEAGLEKYLSQLIQLIIIKPYGPLERVVVDLCAKSLRIAVKVGIHPLAAVLHQVVTLVVDTRSFLWCCLIGTPLSRGTGAPRYLKIVQSQRQGVGMQTYWLLLAVSQDQPKNKYVAELRDCCERAALEGSWVCQLQPSNSI